jgi:hypothetical protein
MPATRLGLLAVTLAAVHPLIAGDPEAPSPGAERAAASPQSLYVAPTGSDTADGSEAHPFQTISRAARAARPNTTVFVAPGTYEGGFKTTAPGTAEGRIRFLSTTRWGAKLVPPAISKTDTAWDNRGSYVDVEGFEIDGSVTRQGTPWTHGIYFGGSYGLISHNHVHHLATATPCTSAGGSAIGVDSYYHGAHIDVVANVVHDIGPPGCHFVQGIYVSTSGTVKNNVVYRVSEAAIHLWHDASDVVISHNTVAGSHTGSSSAAAISTTPPARMTARTSSTTSSTTAPTASPSKAKPACTIPTTTTSSPGAPSPTGRSKTASPPIP